MSPRSSLNRVKFQVRDYALRRRNFTVADLVRETGLNPSSVRTELQRLKDEGLLTVWGKLPGPKKRGGGTVLYQLTSDPEARLNLWASVKAFYGPAPAPTRPTSRHYGSARKGIDEAIKAAAPQDEQLLAQAEADLEVACQAEGASLASEAIKAYLGYETARILFWRGVYAGAKTKFEALREKFTGLGDEAKVEAINEFLQCIEGLSSQTEPPGRVQAAVLKECLDKALAGEACKSDRPFALLMGKLIQQWPQTGNEEIRKDTETIIKQQAQLYELQKEILRKQTTAVCPMAPDRRPSVDEYGPEKSIPWPQH
jgi:lambda repressor-like predicted transcriptional regulator